MFKLVCMHVRAHDGRPMLLLNTLRAAWRCCLDMLMFYWQVLLTANFLMTE